MFPIILLVSVSEISQLFLIDSKKILRTKVYPILQEFPRPNYLSYYYTQYFYSSILCQQLPPNHLL